MSPAILDRSGDRWYGRIVRHRQRARLLGFVLRSALELEHRLIVLSVFKAGGADPGDVRSVRHLVVALHSRPRRT